MSELATKINDRDRVFCVALDLENIQQSIDDIAAVCMCAKDSTRMDEESKGMFGVLLRMTLNANDRLLQATSELEAVMPRLKCDETE